MSGTSERRPFFRFLVLTCQRRNGLLALLDSIFQLEFPPGADFEVLVWDNGSGAETRFALREGGYAAEKRLVYHRSPENCFMRGKRHLEEIALARWDGGAGHYVIHVDDDVQLTSLWLQHAWTAAKTHAWDACGSVEDWESTRVYSGQSRLHLVDERVGEQHVSVWDWHWEPIYGTADSVAVEFAGHRALLVRMEAVRQVLHDPVLLIGGEDVDYSLSLRSAGLKLGISHGALIWHRALGETDVEGFRTFERVLGSWRHFFQKWRFVRRSAANEAGIAEAKWLRLVTQLDEWRA